MNGDGSGGKKLAKFESCPHHEDNLESVSRFAVLMNTENYLQKNSEALASPEPEHLPWQQH
jgi:hypothetical protein